MKSREEIIRKLPHMMEYPNFIDENDVEQAMTEYADQFAVEFAEWCIVVGYEFHEGKGWNLGINAVKKYMSTADLLTIFKKERGIE